jgi:glycosyltransferase involved in cell wall biosynthesis
MQLRLILGNKALLIGRHHADRVPGGGRKMLQKFADRCLDAYLFTSLGNACDWVSEGIIKNKQKVLELPAASTEFSGMDKEICRKTTGMAGSKNFLWVGRLNANKDPLTVLEGFEKYLAIEPGAMLYMVFQEGDLLKQVIYKTRQNEMLNRAVHLVGILPHDNLQEWYSAADYYISGSHSEGGSYALLEAMACGCIPIVTDIPAALKMTGDGRYGIVFRKGDAGDLYRKLNGLSSIDQAGLSDAIVKYFRSSLSTAAIADGLYRICIGLSKV